MSDEPQNTADMTASAAESSASPALFGWAVASSVVLVVGAFLLIRLATSPRENLPTIAILGLLLFAAISFGPAIIVRRCGGRVFDGRRPVRPLIEAGVAILCVLGLFLALCGTTLVLPESFVEAENAGDGQQEALTYFGTIWHWVGFALVACVWAPIFEEIGFRRFLFRAFQPRMGTATAALVSSAIFAAAHSYAAYGTVVIFVMGLLLCGVYVKRRTLITPMILHAVNNAVFMLVLFVQMQLQPLTPSLGVSGEERPEGFQIMSVQPGSPADAAGMRAGDLLTELGDHPVKSVIHLRRVLTAHEIGDDVTAVVVRDGVSETLHVKLTQTMAEMQSAAKRLRVSGSPSDVSAEGR